MEELVDRLSTTSDLAVGIGSAHDGDAADITVASIAQAGPGEVVAYRTSTELVAALVEGRVDAVVRGTLSSHETLQELMGATGSSTPGRVALMAPEGGPAFLLTPVGIDEGRDMGERWTLLEHAVELAMSLDVEPRVAVMSMGRPEDTGRGAIIAQSARECEALRSAAETRGIVAECVGIQLERAVGSANVILAPDGVTGNLIFRSLHLVAGLGSWGAVATGVLPLVYIDTSRERSDFRNAIDLARTVASVK
jgi:predicted methyltransferase MtxX (methanogen marker protein 4)